MVSIRDGLRGDRARRSGLPAKSFRIRRRTLSFLTCPHDGFKDLHIPSAPTKISREPFANCGVVRMRVLFQQTHSSDHHSWRADAALRATAFDESLLHVV